MDKAEGYWSEAGPLSTGRKARAIAIPGGINTPRLRLRRVHESDADTIALLVSDWEVSKQTTSIPSPYTLTDARKFVDDAACDWQSGAQYVLCIERRSDKCLIGTVSVQVHSPWWARVLRHKSGEIGYWAGREYWGEGYTSEAVEAFMVFAREKVGLRKIIARVFTENEASLRLLRRAGFNQAAVKTEVLPHRGGKRKIIHMHYKSK